MTAPHSFTHDNLYVCQLHNQSDTVQHLHPTSVSQGLNNFERVGTSVKSIGFQVQGMFSVPFDRRNVSIKIWLVSFNSSQGSPLDPAHFYKNITNNTMLDGINNDRFPGVKLYKTLRVQARDLYVEHGELVDAGADATINYKFWVPWKRDCKYSDGTGVGPKTGFKEALWLIMSAYDTPSTSNLTDLVVRSNEQRVTWFYRDA